MKTFLFLIIFGFFHHAFVEPETKPIYKISFSSEDCYFYIKVNNKLVYKNEKQYKVYRTIPIDAFLVKKDSQYIESFMYNRHTMMELTGKSKFEIYITKNIGEKVDTIYKSNFINDGSPDEKGKMKYASRIGESRYFHL